MSRFALIRYKKKIQMCLYGKSHWKSYCLTAVGFVDSQGSASVPETHPAQPGTSFSTVQPDPQPQHTLTHPQSIVSHFLYLSWFSELVMLIWRKKTCFFAFSTKLLLLNSHSTQPRPLCSSRAVLWPRVPLPRLELRPHTRYTSCDP